MNEGPADLALLEAGDIGVTYANGVEALRGVGLSLRPGERVSIVGPSGCGKSTLLRVLCGLLPASRGRLMLDGAPLTAPSPRIGILFQDPALLPWRSVQANVQLPLELLPAGALPDAQPSSARGLLEMMGLLDFAHALPHELSGGMAQRAALARALMTQPPILLLDEPFGALDALTREALTASVNELARSRGTALVLVTHSIPEAVFLADRVLVLTGRPGRPAGEVPVPLPYPRHWEMEPDPVFVQAAADVRRLLAGGHPLQPRI